LPLGFSTYQADNLSSAGWLKSTGFFESGTTYVTFYNEYRTRIGEKFSGGFVRSVDDTYTDYDLVIDEANQMFRLPLLDGSETIVDYENTVMLGYITEYQTLPCNAYVFYVRNSLGSTDNSGFYYANENETFVRTFFQALTYERYGLGLFLEKGWKVKSYGVDSTLHYAPLKGNGSLYYKVGNAVQHLEVVDMLHQAELNNPFFYGMYQYFQTEPNNASWLASLGQWNSKGIYTDYYNWVLENVGKYYFKLSTEEYTDYDWVINKVDETFRLPVKVKGASGSAVVGNGMTLGLTNGSTNVGLYAGSDEPNNRYLFNKNAYGLPVDSSVSSATGDEGTYGITTDPTNSGIETSTDGLTLYFYVGEVLQSANLINAGRALEKIAKLQAYKMGKLDYSSGIAVTYPISTAKFTVPKDGVYILSCVTSEKVSCYINDALIFIKSHPSNSVDYVPMFIPLSQGDVIYFDKSATTTLTSIFYPCKEVN
jgi:hypothetical protein